jgi:hypothetical protein
MTKLIEIVMAHEEREVQHSIQTGPEQCVKQGSDQGSVQASE